jgi:uncharacterized protein YjbI with pentapeptide repeats
LFKLRFLWFFKKERCPLSEQDGRQPVAQQRPTPNDQDEWKAYWKAQGQSWRTEPEIDDERQKYLIERRAISPDIKQGIYPFKGVKLCRADVEWLLATHESGGIKGPVDWTDMHQREREGLDVRAADLSQEDLSGLPLARLHGGLIPKEWPLTTQEQQEMAGVLLQDANLEEVILQGAELSNAQMQGAFLWGSQLQGVNFCETQLQGANLYRTQMQGAFLMRAKLQGAMLRRADLEDALLDDVTFSDDMYGPAFLADISWDNVNLATIDWGLMKELGDEQLAQEKDSNGVIEINNEKENLYKCKMALRANRQLAIVLRNQGLNEEADHFAYRAQLLQRKLFRYQGKVGPYLFSILLAMLSGYGYRIWRILIAYIVMVSLFALAYFVLGMHYVPHLPLAQAYLESITAFHGRVFLEQFGVNTPQIWLTALEAVVGLIIEGVFIAMLIQRFFGK